jgi:hypothetical protein
MDLIRNIREAIGAWITPAPKSEALVPVHISNGTWKQVKVGDLTRSYLYTCKCLQLQELTPPEAKDGKIRKCGCGLKYSLLRDLALATDSTITEYEYALATLPVHALAVQQHRRPAVISADWGYDKAGEVIWTGERQASGVQWRG